MQIPPHGNLLGFNSHNSVCAQFPLFFSPFQSFHLFLFFLLSAVGFYFLFFDPFSCQLVQCAALPSGQANFKCCEQVLISVSAEPFTLMAHNPWMVWNIDFYIPSPSSSSSTFFLLLLANSPSHFPSLSSILSISSVFMPFICMFIVPPLASLPLLSLL